MYRIMFDGKYLLVIDMLGHVWRYSCSNNEDIIENLIYHFTSEENLFEKKGY